MASFSSPSNLQKICGICNVVVVKGKGQAVFNAECSHDFHYPCIATYLSNGNRLCPLCSAPWNNLPFPTISPFCPSSSFSLSFSDDDPLPDNDVHHSLLDKVTIKAIPECKAVAASQVVSEFAVLVGLKAPSLPDSHRVPVDIVTVLDVSGSMTGMKLSLVKRAVLFVIQNLGISDRLSIVSFSNRARRIIPLRRMTESGRDDATRAVESLVANGGTNIVDGLTTGARVLEQRRFKNPVSSIIFLSDGNDTYNAGHSSRNNHHHPGMGYLHLLPPSIIPGNGGAFSGATFSVHSFGFGSDHDPTTMHAISDASGGTFSFIESYEMVQDAFAGCIGGLLSVVTQELRLNLRSASHGVEINSIPSGRYKSEISNQGAEGMINVGDLYADEEKEFLINLTVPAINDNSGEDNERKTSLLDITCSYNDAITKQNVMIECDLVQVGRPKSPSPEDLAINMEVDRQRNRLRAVESIQKAQQMAEAGNLLGAANLLAEKRGNLMTSASGQAGDGLTGWLAGEMKETEMRFGSVRTYEQSGRAFALSGMSSHASQRATTRGGSVAGGSVADAPVFSFRMGGPSATGAYDGGSSCAFGGYATPQMANMVSKSKQQQQQQQQQKEG